MCTGAVGDIGICTGRTTSYDNLPSFQLYPLFNKKQQKKELFNDYGFVVWFCFFYIALKYTARNGSCLLCKVVVIAVKPVDILELSF